MKLHEAPAASEEPHVLLLRTNSEGLPFAIPKPLPVLPPTLVTTSDCAPLDCPTVTLPKDNAVGDTESAAGFAGGAAATPVPLIVICTEEPPVKATVRPALSAPAPAGV